MVYIGIIVLLIILIYLFRMMFLRGRYGKQKGDFIAMTLMFTTLPFIFLSNADENVGKFFPWLLTFIIIINWGYSLYVFKSDQQQ